MDVAATFCATLVDEWSRAGIDHAVIAPGSRSTPLVLALRAHGRIRLHVFVDERSAGFYALGIGLASGTPAVVVTTSGTAAAELLPAVVEAHHAGVPLIACTADRPPQSHGIGSPQTIDQSRLYDQALRWRADPGVPLAAATGTWRSLAARAVCEARGVGGRPGPVHVNLPFCEPLVGKPGPVPRGRPEGAAWHRAARSQDSSPPVAELLPLLAKRTGVIIAGAGSGDPDGIHRLAGEMGWPVLADPRSGCRRPGHGTVGAFDALLRYKPLADSLAPEVVVRTGAPPASKVLAGWLASCSAEQVAVEAHGTWLDPERTASVIVAGDPGTVCQALALRRPESAPSGWLARWAGAESAAQRAIDDVLSDYKETTEPGIARALVDCLPAHATLFVSSSMPVRDVEWFGRPRSDLRALSNRGANGIDGVVSTALGAAASRPDTPTAALLGDLAFLHDAGGLLGARRRGLDCVLVVVDNDGGGIFSFLPQASEVQEDDFERLFTTPHGLDLAGLARLHGLSACQIDDARELGPAVQTGFERGGVNVVIARTDHRANVAIHEEIHDAVADSLEALGYR